MWSIWRAVCVYGDTGREVLWLHLLCWGESTQAVKAVASNFPSLVVIVLQETFQTLLHLCALGRSCTAEHFSSHISHAEEIWSCYVFFAVPLSWWLLMHRTGSCWCCRGLESCTTSGVKFLYTSKLVTGGQNFVWPYGFTAFFQFSYTSLSIFHLVAVYPRQQFLCKSCGVRAVLL